MKNSQTDSMSSTGSPLSRQPTFTAIDANVYHGSSRDRARTASKSSAVRKKTRLGASTADSTSDFSATVIFSSNQDAPQLQQSSQLEDSLLKVQQAKYCLFDAGLKGIGLKATEDIELGSFVLEYIGEIISQAEGEKRCQLYETKDVQHMYIFQTRSGLLIDATMLANDARFMNHSCDPNCQAYSCTVEGQERVALVALKPIPKGQELTYDYHVKADAEPVLRCLCEAACCRGFVDAAVKATSRPQPDGHQSNSRRTSTRLAASASISDASHTGADPASENEQPAQAKVTKELRSTPLQASTQPPQSAQKGNKKRQADRSRPFKRLLPPWGFAKGRSASAKRPRHDWGSAFLGFNSHLSHRGQARHDGPAPHLLSQAGQSSNAVADSSLANSSSSSGGAARPVLSQAMLQQLQQLPQHELLVPLAAQGLVLQANVLLATSLQLSLARCCSLAGLARSPGYRQVNYCNSSDPHTPKGMAPAGHRPATRSKPGKSPPPAHPAHQQPATHQLLVPGRLSDCPPEHADQPCPSLAQACAVTSHAEQAAAAAAAAASCLPASSPPQMTARGAAGPSPSDAAALSPSSLTEPLLSGLAVPPAASQAGTSTLLSPHPAAVVCADPLLCLPADPLVAVTAVPGSAPTADPGMHTTTRLAADMLTPPSSSAAAPCSVQPAEPSENPIVSSAAAPDTSDTSAVPLPVHRLAHATPPPKVLGSPAAAASPSKLPVVSKGAELQAAASHSAKLHLEEAELPATAAAEAVALAAIGQSPTAADSSLAPGSQQQPQEARSAANQHPKPPLAPAGFAPAATRDSRRLLNGGFPVPKPRPPARFAKSSGSLPLSRLAVGSFPQPTTPASAAPSTEEEVDVISISDTDAAAISAWKQQLLAHPEPFLTAHQMRKRNKRKRSAVSKPVAPNAVGLFTEGAEQPGQPAAQQVALPPVLTAVMAPAAAADQPGLPAIAHPAAASPVPSLSKPTAPSAVIPRAAAAHQPKQPAVQHTSVPPVSPRPTPAGQTKQHGSAAQADAPPVLILDPLAATQRPDMPVTVSVLPLPSSSPVALPEEAGREAIPASLPPSPSAAIPTSGTAAAPAALHNSTTAEFQKPSSQVAPAAPPASSAAQCLQPSKLALPPVPLESTAAGAHKPGMPAAPFVLPTSPLSEVRRPGAADVAGPAAATPKPGASSQAKTSGIVAGKQMGAQLDVRHTSTLLHRNVQPPSTAANRNNEHQTPDSRPAVGLHRQHQAPAVTSARDSQSTPVVSSCAPNLPLLPTHSETQQGAAAGGSSNDQAGRPAAATLLQQLQQVAEAAQLQMSPQREGLRAVQLKAQQPTFEQQLRQFHLALTAQLQPGLLPQLQSSLSPQLQSLLWSHLMSLPPLQLQSPLPAQLQQPLPSQQAQQPPQLHPSLPLPLSTFLRPQAQPLSLLQIPAPPPAPPQPLTQTHLHIPIRPQARLHPQLRPHSQPHSLPAAPAQPQPVQASPHSVAGVSWQTAAPMQLNAQSTEHARQQPRVRSDLQPVLESKRRSNEPGYNPFALQSRLHQTSAAPLQSVADPASAPVGHALEPHNAPCQPSLGKSPLGQRLHEHASSVAWWTDGSYLPGLAKQAQSTARQNGTLASLPEGSRGNQCKPGSAEATVSRLGSMHKEATKGATEASNAPLLSTASPLTREWLEAHIHQLSQRRLATHAPKQNLRAWKTLPAGSPA